MTLAVVLDIEGTVSPLSAVHDVLFPYARERLESWVRQDRPGTQAVVDEVRAVLGGHADLDDVVRTLLEWHDGNAKHSPLKTLHGLVWERGFLGGELSGVIYPDVPPALAGWRRRGTPCWIYSSGSVLAQRLWFSRSDQGDLGGYLAGHFDTLTGGPKQDPASYRRIGRAIGTPARDVLFLSDSRAELDAARTAGWATIGVSRPGCTTDFGTHRAIADFTEFGTAREVAS
ncbi:acireductone synthase [Amycolatopsis vancoresmycina]|uniref:Enolase-phosphatase E1 n=1 Tax=Amycolatopsis vancoresmycina DSM 44592 TaxID=1292037 RepID=R1FVX8_9PSEU|nr:acireductone synthase [Amycolatopsis vancoresmycina]EOD63543.1 2,3-diketo-5-methylthio-1-phosphopentane phosphatase [Amycolatopsis vancoresmycina DSM 44592]